MAASTSLLGYKIVFAALGCFMLATLTYTLVTDGSPFRRELFTPWMAATLADFYINVVAISVWVIYKESSWIHSVFWIISLVCFGSIATCAYIVKKLFEISCQDAAQDPLDLLFLRSGQVRKGKCSFIIFWKIFFSVLGLFLASVIIFTLVTDGSPFRRELLTPWMVATLIDFYINIFAISVWVTHKESSWIGACFWICLLICFGGVTTCGYIVIQLFWLSNEDQAYQILLDSHGKGGKDAPSSS